MDKKHHIVHIVIFFLTFLIVLGLLFYVLQVTSTTTTPSIRIPEKANNRAPLALNSASMLNEVYERINNNPKFTYQFGPPERDLWGLWWVSNDGWSIYDSGALSMDMAIPVAKGWAGNVNATHPMAQEMNKAVSQIFLVSGFKPDAVNFSKNERDDQFYDYILAFRSGETRCALVTDGDVSVEGEKEFFIVSVSCSDNFNKKYEEQSPYLRDLGLKGVVISPVKSVGDFIKLDAHARRSGYYIIAKKETLKWVNIYEGQDAPPCSVVKKYAIPQEIYGECF